MQAGISQALMAIRVADLRRQAEVARLAREVKRNRRQARRLARMAPAPAAQPACRPGRAGLGAV
jgi:hypothetical protein